MKFCEPLRESYQTKSFYCHRHESGLLGRVLYILRMPSPHTVFVTSSCLLLPLTVLPSGTVSPDSGYTDFAIAAGRKFCYETAWDLASYGLGVARRHHSWSVRPPFLAHVLAASHVSVTTESNTGSENRHISGWQQAPSTGQL